MRTRMVLLNLSDLDTIIQSLLATGTLESFEFVRGYDFVYDYCHQLPAKKKSDKLTAMADQRRMLYNHISSLLASHTDKIYQQFIAAPTKDEWLYCYNHEFEKYQRSIAILIGICRYLQNRWIKPERAEGNNSILEVDQLGKTIWREHLFDKIQQDCTNKVLEHIEAERNGVTIDHLLLHKFIETYIELDFDGTKQYYEKNFEKTFLEHTKAFYVVDFEENYKKCAQFTNFVEHIAHRLYEEALRSRANVSGYLERSTFQKVHQIFIEIMVTKYKKQIIAEFTKCLQILAIANEEQRESMNEMYMDQFHQFINKILAYSAEMSKELSDILELQIRNDGEQALHSKTVSKYPQKHFINEIYKVLNYYKECITNLYDSNSNFNNALEKACTHCIKEYGSTKAAKLLCLYCNSLMKKRITDDELNTEFNKILEITKYVCQLQEDFFHFLYSQELVKRLINCESTSDDMEESLIRRFQQEKYNTAKAEILFHDIRYINWKSRLKSYLHNTNIKLEFDFKINIIRDFIWPLKRYNLNLILPPILENSVQVFEQFYKTTNNNRLLNWRYEVGGGELVANCFQKKYRFKVNTLQMIILLQFNKQLHYTVQELAQNTNIACNIVIEIVEHLLQIGLLKCDEIAEPKSLKENHKVELRLNFDSKELIIKIDRKLMTLNRGNAQSTNQTMKP